MLHPTAPEIKTLLQHEKFEDLKSLLIDIDPADLADLIEEIDNPELSCQLLPLLDPVQIAETLVEMEPGSSDDLLEKETPEQIANHLSNMPPDDAADILEELELNDEESQAILELLPQADKLAITKLLGYEDDSGGSIMTPELCALPADTTVAQAMEAIGKADLSDPIMFVYVVEPTSGVLMGQVYLSHLISQPDSKNDTGKSRTYSTEITLADLVDVNYTWASTAEDQEEIANKFRKYNLWVMPVVDEKHRLVGRITADDILEVIQEEANEDMAKMIGAPDFEEPDDSALKAVRLRLPWLLVTMVAGLANSLLIDNIQSATQITTVAIFIPVLMAMGGNTSIQATAIAVREIAMGRLNTSMLWKTVAKQISIGTMMGFISGLFVWGGAYGVLVYINPQDVDISRLSLAIAISMWIGMIFASVFGSLVPIILDKFHIDPAIASGPFVTTSNDLSASTIYFITCMLLIM